MRALLLALLWCLVLPGAARAADNTYCVGGYTGAPPHIAAACNRPGVTRKHRKWHFHTFVRLGNECFACYDEVDNSCITDFLGDHPRFRRVSNPFDCRKQDTSDKVFKHVKNGVDISPKRKPPTPPPVKDPAPSPPSPSRPDPIATPKPTPVPTPRPPKPVSLTTKLDSVSPGPYAAGDTVKLVASVRDGRGDIRTVPGGHFVISTADGQRREVPAVLAPDGRLRADVALPSASGVSITFVADPPRLQPHETFKKTDTTPQQLKVDTCAFRAHVKSPTSGTALVVDQTSTLAARFMRPDGSEVAAPAGLSLTFTIERPGGDAITLSAKPDGTTTWTAGIELVDQPLTVVAGGTAGGLQVCPGPEVPFTVTELGLGWDTSNLPTRCYGTVECKGTGTLVLPEGTARARVNALLADPTTRVILYNGAEQLAELPPSPDHSYTFAVTYPDSQHAAWRLVVRGPTGDTELPMHEVDVRPPLRLELPEVLDFGTVIAGTSFTEVCAGLDFSGSQAAQEHEWRIVVTGADACIARPVLAFRNLFGMADKVDLTVEARVKALDPARPILDICLDTPACAGETSPPDVKLVVIPATPEFASQRREVRLVWTVEGRSWFACHGWWLWPLLLLLLIAFVTYGFVSPHRFAPHLAIRVAGSPSALRRQSAIGLTGLPGSGSGWYLNARLGLFHSGELRGDVSGAAVVLEACKGGLVLRGTLEIQDRRTRAWRPVDDPQGHLPDGSSVYRTGDVVFKLEV